MSLNSTARYKYNPNEMSEDEFLQRFVVRHEIFEEVFEALQNADYSVPNQHHILVGQRGQGKTTILRKLNIGIKKDKKLSKFLIPVQFPEEQHNMRGLCSLWERVAEHLEDNHDDIFEDALENVEIHDEDENYDIKCFSYLERQLTRQKKKLVLLIDNINILLESLNTQEQHQLREILLTSSQFIIVGGSTRMFEQQYDYSKPFYEFFNIIPMDGLTFNESVELLKVLGDSEQKKKIENFITNNPARIETLRRITGGVPRTIVMLFDIFIEDNSDTFNDLIKVLDEATPLYQDRMKHLPQTLKNITHAIAINWDGMLTREIVKKVKLESKVVSAQLKQLEKYQIVESVSIGKNKIYSIKERFFNIWYLMRFGKKRDRNKVEWLIKFLLSWYDKNELENKAKRFQKSLIHGDRLNEHYVYNMGEALRYTGHLELQQEYDLKQTMQKFFKNKNSNLYKNISNSDAEILKKAFDLENLGELDKAIKLLIKSKRESKSIITTIALLYHKQKEYNKAEEYYLKAVESGDTGALNNLGILHSEQKEYNKAEEYYLKAVESGDTGALNNLGILHSEQKEYNKAEEYYLKAVESGDTGALNNLGILHSEQKEYNKAEEYYLKAVESGDTGASNSLAWFYFEQAKKRNNANMIIKDDYTTRTSYYNVHTFATILLWSEEFSKSYEKFEEWLMYDKASKSKEDVTIYLNLLISKGQLYKVKEFMEIPKYQLKERYKPIWYALMTLMQDDFPTEIKKMGSELKETVNEILIEIEAMREKYSLDD